MTRKPSPDDAPTPPSEFTSFIRRIGIDSFDRFAQKKIERTTAATRSNPLQSLASIWLDLTPDEKKRFFDQVIAAGQAAAVAAPAVLARAKSKTAKKSAEKPDKADVSPTEDEKKKKEKRSKKKKGGKDSDEKKSKKSRKKD